MNLREIDAAVAVAMGWTEKEIDGQVLYDTWHTTRISATETVSSGCLTALPHFTISISAAWQVVGWIVKQGKFFFELYNDALGYSLDLIPIRLEDEADLVCGDRAPTAPLAICLAFLRAMGVEVEE